MQLSWLMRLRIAAAVAIGVMLIGILAWPMMASRKPFAPISLVEGNIGLADAITLASLSFLAGFLAYFFCWPYGREIAILAVPSGLAVWAIRCGSMADLMAANPAAQQRQALFAALRWEPIFWLAMVAIGFVGTILASLMKRASRDKRQETRDGRREMRCLNAAIALFASIFIAHTCIRIFARDVEIFDHRLGLLSAQPSVRQIAFAVLVSFGIAAFVVKKFLNVSFLWPVIASGLVTAFAITTYIRQGVLAQLVDRCPAVFFPNPVLSILPIQMVAFGTLGSIIGYWLAVRAEHRRKHT